ncbi:MAG: stage II sporulation protein E [Bacillota bacterium]
MKRAATTGSVIVRNSILRDLSAMASSLIGHDALYLTLVALFLGRAMILTNLSPFAPAYFAAVMATKSSRSLLVGLAILFGAAWNDSLRFLAENLLFMAAFSAALSVLRLDGAQKRRATPGLTFGLITVVKLSSALVIERTPYALFNAGFDVMLCTILCFIFLAGVPLIVKQRKLRVLSAEEVLCLVILITGAMTGMKGLSVAGMSIQDVFSGLLIMAAALAGGTGMGASIGAIVGAIASFSGTPTPAALGAAAFSGLLGGAFREFGKAGTAAGYLIGRFAVLLYFQAADQPMLALLETAAAAGLFLIWPRRQLEALSRLVAGTGEQSKRQALHDRQLREMTSQRLKEFGKVFLELSSSFEQIAETAEDKAQDRNLSKFFSAVASRLCENCPRYRHCWEQDFYATYQRMLDLLTIAELNNGLLSEEIPEETRQKCIKVPDLGTTINYLFELYRTDHFWQKRVAESRQLISGQLRGIAGIMDSLAGEIQLDVEFHEELEEMIADGLESAGIDVEQLSAARMGGRHLDITVTSTPCWQYDHCSRQALPVVGRLLGQNLACEKRQCHWRDGRSRCSFRIYPARSYDYRVGTSRRAKEPNVISGDSYAIKEVRDGKLMVILSDGMGNGPRAALESRATVSLLEELVEVGFDTDLAVQTVNSILVLRSPEEIFATLDMLVVDLHTGDAEFIKIGAAPSFHRRGDTVEVIKRSSLPLGILSIVDIERCQVALRPDDIVVLVSDGALASGRETRRNEDWLARYLKRCDTRDPEVLARDIVEQAAGDREIGADDMTAIVVQVFLRED